MSALRGLRINKSKSYNSLNDDHLAHQHHPSSGLGDLAHQHQEEEAAAENINGDGKLSIFPKPKKLLSSVYLKAKQNKQKMMKHDIKIGKGGGGGGGREDSKTDKDNEQESKWTNSITKTKKGNLKNNGGYNDFSTPNERTDKDKEHGNERTDKDGNGEGSHKTDNSSKHKVVTRLGKLLSPASESASTKKNKIKNIIKSKFPTDHNRNKFVDECTEEEEKVDNGGRKRDGNNEIIIISEIGEKNDTELEQNVIRKANKEEESTVKFERCPAPLRETVETLGLDNADTEGCIPSARDSTFETCNIDLFKCDLSTETHQQTTLLKGNHEEVTDYSSRPMDLGDKEAFVGNKIGSNFNFNPTNIILAKISPKKKKIDEELTSIESSITSRNKDYIYSSFEDDLGKCSSPQQDSEENQQGKKINNIKLFSSRGLKSHFTTKDFKLIDAKKQNVSQKSSLIESNTLDKTKAPPPLQAASPRQTKLFDDFFEATEADWEASFKSNLDDVISSTDSCFQPQNSAEFGDSDHNSSSKSGKRLRQHPLKSLKNRIGKRTPEMLEKPQIGVYDVTNNVEDDVEGSSNSAVILQSQLNNNSTVITSKDMKYVTKMKKVISAISPKKNSKSKSVKENNNSVELQINEITSNAVFDPLFVSRGNTDESSTIFSENSDNFNDFAFNGLPNRLTDLSNRLTDLPNSGSAFEHSSGQNNHGGLPSKLTDLPNNFTELASSRSGSEHSFRQNNLGDSLFDVESGPNSVNFGAQIDSDFPGDPFSLNYVTPHDVGDTLDPFASQSIVLNTQNEFHLTSSTSSVQGLTSPPTSKNDLGRFRTLDKVSIAFNHEPLTTSTFNQGLESLSSRQSSSDFRLPPPKPVVNRSCHNLPASLSLRSSVSMSHLSKHDLDSCNSNLPSQDFFPLRLEDDNFLSPSAAMREKEHREKCLGRAHNSKHSGDSSSSNINQKEDKEHPEGSLERNIDHCSGREEHSGKSSGRTQHIDDTGGLEHSLTRSRLAHLSVSSTNLSFIKKKGNYPHLTGNLGGLEKFKGQGQGHGSLVDLGGDTEYGDKQLWSNDTGRRQKGKKRKIKAHHIFG